MHDLLTRLSAEHAELQQALAGIRPRQFRTDEGRTRIGRVRELLRSHITTEKEQLYPSLESAARHDARLANQLQRMTDDLRIVTGLAEDFFCKYESGTPGPTEFATDHGALLTIIRIRLKREEDIIFLLFDQVNKN